MRSRFFASLIFSVSVFSPTLHAADLNKGLACFNEKDYACAVAEWRPLAEQGNAQAQHNLGILYANGQGVKQDSAESVKWYRKAADQGVAGAQHNLGLMYDFGKGVKKDHTEAARWYRKAAEQGLVNAQVNLAFLYRHGRGVKQDYFEAVKWYRKAADQGDAEAQTKVTKLTNILNCKDNASTQLFGQNILCATRKDMRTALKSSGVKANREEDNYFADLYDSRNVLNESEKLAVYYIKGDFAKATYTLPSHVDSGQVSRIRSMVASKYGAPTYSSGSPSLGAVTYTWDLKDGIELKVSREWPDTTTYLTYTHPENNRLLDARLAEMEAENKKKEFAAQSNAF